MYVATGTQLDAASCFPRKGSPRASSAPEIRAARCGPPATSRARSSAADWKPVALMEGISAKCGSLGGPSDRHLAAAGCNGSGEPGVAWVERGQFRGRKAMAQEARVAIVGGGIAGLAAAAFAARAGARVTLLERMSEMGGRARTRSRPRLRLQHGTACAVPDGRGDLRAARARDRAGGPVAGRRRRPRVRPRAACTRCRAGRCHS